MAIELSDNLSSTQSWQTYRLSKDKSKVLEVDLHKEDDSTPYAVTRWQTSVDEKSALAIIAKSYWKLKDKYAMPQIEPANDEFEDVIRAEPFAITMGKKDAQLNETSSKVFYFRVSDVVFEIYFPPLAGRTEFFENIENSQIVPDNFYWARINTVFGDYFIDGKATLEGGKEKARLSRVFGFTISRYLLGEIIELYEKTGNVRLEKEELWQLHTELGKKIGHLPPLDSLI